MTPRLERPAAVLFDWDNTLVDSWPTIHDALNHTLVEMGHPPWSFAETKARTRYSMRDSFPLLFGDRWMQAQTVFLDAFEAMHLDRLHAIPGARSSLESLSEQGLYLGIVSNKTGRLLRLEVERLGWTGLFGCVIGAGDAPFDKPARDPIDLALRPGGIVAGRTVWYVGDTQIDLVCARNAGCIPVLMTAGDAVGELGEWAVTPDHSFASWDALAAAFGRMDLYRADEVSIEGMS